MLRAIITIENIHLLPRPKNQVFIVEQLVSLTFLTASGYPATAGLTIAHLGNQMGRTSCFWCLQREVTEMANIELDDILGIVDSSKGEIICKDCMTEEEVFHIAEEEAITKDKILK
ncbi:MAG: hypothetical protein GWN93_20550, partial [Deltaproteobacteria bacterium]|nr:hypothetical protein [Deltaproteobacteria bacterium]